MYGRIWDDDGLYIVEQLSAIEGTLDCHLHTPGGDVVAGNLIYNYLLERGVNTHNDGYVASMGTMLFLAGQKRTMANNAILMKHAPRMGTSGTAKEIRKELKLLEELEEIMIQQYMDRSGQTREVVETWMDGDNYFTLADAKKYKLVTHEAAPVFTKEQMAAYSTLKAVAVDKDQDEKLFLSAIDDSQKSKNPKISKMKKDAISALKLEGVSEESSDTAVINAIQQKLDAKEGDYAKLEAKLEALEKKAKEDEKAAITAAVEAAVKDGKITEKSKANWQKVGEDSGLTALNNLLGEMTGRGATITSKINADAPSTIEATAKKWDDMQKEDGETLEAMAKPDHAKHADFKALYKAKFGKEYTA